MGLNNKIKKILIATKNPAKLKEIKFGLKEIEKLGITLLTLNDVKSREELKSPEESGETFCENAKIKAYFYAQLTNLPTIADDGGLIIPFEGKIRGYIANKPSVKRIEGYPFRALFIVEKFNKFYDELTEKEHHQINHRLKALRKIVKVIKSRLFQSPPFHRSGVRRLIKSI